MNEIFPFIFRIFLILGTIVGVIVISYMIYNAYKYREGAEHASETDADRPQLGELPKDEGGGRKLAVSLVLSAIIVISLITWTYFLLRDVEGDVPDPGDEIDVRVEGYRFGWQFTYPNGHTSDTLRVPKGRTVSLTVTSRDVIHTFGIPAFETKTDAIPGQTTDAWFSAPKTGTYRAQCFELCGSGHSTMDAEVIVMKPEKYEKWYTSTGSKNTSSSNNNNNSSSIENTISMGYNDRQSA